MLDGNFGAGNLGAGNYGAGNFRACNLLDGNLLNSTLRASNVVVVVVGCGAQNRKWSSHIQISC